MSQAAYFSDQPKSIERVYGGGRREQLQAELDFFPTIVSSENFNQNIPEQGFCFSLSWSAGNKGFKPGSRDGWINGDRIAQTTADG